MNDGAIELRFYSAALDEIYRLRAALAHEAAERETDVAMSTFPRSRLRAAHDSIVRMRAAAQGHSDIAYEKQDWYAPQQWLESVGASHCLTRHSWEQEVARGVPESQAAAASVNEFYRNYDRTTQRWALSLAIELAPKDDRLVTLLRDAPLLLWSSTPWDGENTVGTWRDLARQVETHYLTAALHQLTHHGHPEWGHRQDPLSNLGDVETTAISMLGFVTLEKSDDASGVLTALLTYVLACHPLTKTEARLRRAARKVSGRREFHDAGLRWTGRRKNHHETDADKDNIE